MNETPMYSVTDTPSHFKQGDRVRILKGQYKGRTGTIERTGYSTGLLIDSVPLYFVRLDLLVYERDHIERVEVVEHE